MITRLRARLLVLAVLALAVIAAALTASAGHKTAAHQMTPAVGASPKYAVEGRIDPDLQVGPLRSCQTRLTPSAAGSCYGPDQIRQAYAIQPLLDAGITGKGRTIVIIDAFGSNTIQSDLPAFDGYFGLPDPTLNIIEPQGTPSTPSSPADGFSWKAETTLDVEWAHTVAPGATIDLVVAKSDNDADILAATKYVADHNLGDVVSQSFGEAEACMDPSLLTQQHAVFGQLAAEHVTVFASTGDEGAALPTCDGTGYMKATSTPATDPLVTAVGGTQLIAAPATANPDGTVMNIGGTWMSETTWNEGVGLSDGGGVSSIYGRPDFQAPVVKDTHMREIPDISYNAAVNGGVLGVLTCGPTECGLPQATYFFRFGGTSAGSPQWSGLVALADQMAGGRIGGINQTLYKLGKGGSAGSYFHDITTGNNSVAASSIPGTPITGYSALPGWDEATGWGTPIFNTLVPALAKAGNG